ncbi:MAG: MarR family transcriptional regulator [Litorimonas sp.]
MPFDQCLYFNSTNLARVLTRRWERAYAPTGLSPALAYLLRQILNQPGSSQRDLADSLTLERSTVTRLLDKLIEKSLIEKRPHDSDRRSLLIWPTAKARSLRPTLDSIGAQLASDMRNRIGDSDLSKLVIMEKSATARIQS